MSAKAASARTQAKSSPNTNKSAKSTRKTRQQPDSTNEEKERPSTSPYFKKQLQYDSDALDEESDAGVKKRKSTARGSKSTPSQNKKRKIEQADEAYDEEAEPSASEKPYDSDALDDSDGPTAKPKRKGRASAKASPKKTQSPRKKKKQVDSGNAEYDDLEDGQEVVGMVVQAPKTGHVPAGQISQNTLNFLNKLQDPACNDREWYVHAPLFTPFVLC
jgi:hypothetical protein